MPGLVPLDRHGGELLINLHTGLNVTLTAVGGAFVPTTVMLVIGLVQPSGTDCVTTTSMNTAAAGSDAPTSPDETATTASTTSSVVFEGTLGQDQSRFYAFTAARAGSVPGDPSPQFLTILAVPVSLLSVRIRRLQRSRAYVQECYAIEGPFGLRPPTARPNLPSNPVTFG